MNTSDFKSDIWDQLSAEQKATHSAAVLAGFKDTVDALTLGDVIDLVIAVKDQVGTVTLQYRNAAPCFGLIK